MSAVEGWVKVRLVPKERREVEGVTWPDTVPQVAWVSMERGDLVYCDQT